MHSKIYVNEKTLALMSVEHLPLGKHTSHSEVLRAILSCFCFRSIMGAPSQSAQDTFVYHSFKFVMQADFEEGLGERGERDKRRRETV